eukprot:1318761-Amorphochlora_amoeboformis.AAC.1
MGGKHIAAAKPTLRLEHRSITASVVDLIAAAKPTLPLEHRLIKAWVVELHKGLISELLVGGPLTELSGV